MKQKYFSKGIKDGTPIALGYFAVSFSLGIAMKKADMTAFQGFLISLVNLASAGEYADLQVILSNGTYLEMAHFFFHFPASQNDNRVWYYR